MTLDDMYLIHHVAAQTSLHGMMSKTVNSIVCRLPKNICYDSSGRRLSLQKETKRSDSQGQAQRRCKCNGIYKSSSFNFEAHSLPRLA